MRIIRNLLEFFLLWSNLIFVLGIFVFAAHFVDAENAAEANKTSSCNDDVEVVVLDIEASSSSSFTVIFAPCCGAVVDFAARWQFDLICKQRALAVCHGRGRGTGCAFILG